MTDKLKQLKEFIVMLKYVDTKIVFREIPDHITLAINFSNCNIGCEGCHSPELREDTGKEFNSRVLDKLIKKNKGITCVCFMGGDNDPKHINFLADYMYRNYPEISIAWYSGKANFKELSDVDLWNFDYIKVGPYIKKKGPLTSKKTNQRLYKIAHSLSGGIELLDITHKFWKDDKDS